MLTNNNNNKFLCKGLYNFTAKLNTYEKACKAMESNETLGYANKFQNR